MSIVIYERLWRVEINYVYNAVEEKDKRILFIIRKRL